MLKVIKAEKVIHLRLMASITWRWKIWVRPPLKPAKQLTPREETVWNIYRLFFFSILTFNIFKNVEAGQAAQNQGRRPSWGNLVFKYFVVEYFCSLSSNIFKNVEARQAAYMEWVRGLSRDETEHFLFSTRKNLSHLVLGLPYQALIYYFWLLC